MKQRRYLHTVLAEAGQRQGVSLKTMEDRMEAAFDELRESTGTLTEMARLLGHRLDCPITASQVKSWMERYGKAPLEPVRHDVQAEIDRLTAEKDELWAQNVRLRERNNDLENLFSRVGEILELA